MRASRLVIAAVVGALIGLLIPHAGAQSTIPVRPSRWLPDGPPIGFTNPEKARDTSALSAAGAGMSAHCHLVCLNPQTVSTVWSLFPGGYSYPAPLKLVVRWSSSAIFVLSAGTAGSIEAKVEYSTDGGGNWDPIEVFVATAPPNTSKAPHDVSVELAQNQDVAQVQVRATLTVRMTSCPIPCTASTSHVTGAAYIWDIRLEASGCHIPTAEATVSAGWHSGMPTWHKFVQVLTPPAAGVDFFMRTVTEQDPGGGGPDLCYFPQSIYDPWEAITGGSWQVGVSNDWGPDTLGWSTGVVTYYRDQFRAPCHTSFYQRMVIDCGNAKPTYTTNVLRSGFDYTDVWVERSGVLVQRQWP